MSLKVRLRRRWPRTSKQTNPVAVCDNFPGIIEFWQVRGKRAYFMNFPDSLNLSFFCACAPLRTFSSFRIVTSRLLGVPDLVKRGPIKNLRDFKQKTIWNLLLTLDWPVFIRYCCDIDSESEQVSRPPMSRSEYFWDFLPSPEIHLTAEPLSDLPLNHP